VFSTPDSCFCPSLVCLSVCSPHPVRYAATKGDTVKLRAMLQQGFNPDSADYGKGVASAVAAHCGGCTGCA
jgi:hypothetical protein